ncbi:unnamed protein product [Prorocentrum cordatum]|uniref:Fe2OG dioxygenase domain-containing protein n=1 Tax=Prorocentrum cordatum TaxID=2364126 RepID=A0ABN9Q9L6_9DINO|nr:unnamed protein product [Polarella glacialis]
MGCGSTWRSRCPRRRGPRRRRSRRRRPSGPPRPSATSSRSRGSPSRCTSRASTAWGSPTSSRTPECRKIVDYAETLRFSVQQRARVLNMQWVDIVDGDFAEAIWSLCGLGWFFRTISVDGLVPCGLNEVIRIQKYGQGCLFGRHTDQYVKRADGKVSKYSLRVFLNGREERWFEGGMSAFHVPFRQEPVVFEPETGLALLYPQGEHCAVQEETEVFAGTKYVLRADVLFCRPEDLPPHRRPGAP